MKNYTMKHNIALNINGTDVVILTGNALNGNTDITAVGKDVKDVTFNVVATKRIPKAALDNLMNQKKTVNEVFFNNILNDGMITETRRISTGGGHNEITTYDDKNINLVAQGAITVDKKTAKTIIEHDKAITAAFKEERKLKKQIEQLEKQAYNARQDAYKTARKTLEVAK